MRFSIRCAGAWLEITDSQQPTSGLFEDLSGQPFILPVMLTGQLDHIKNEIN